MTSFQRKLTNLQRERFRGYACGPLSCSPRYVGELPATATEDDARRWERKLRASCLREWRRFVRYNRTVDPARVYWNHAYFLTLTNADTRRLATVSVRFV